MHGQDLECATNTIRELGDEEIKLVAGGHPLMVVLTAYAVADIGYDAYKGFRDGFRSMAN